MLSAVSGYEAVLDLYKCSAFSLMAAQREAKFANDPVARIDLPAAQFFGLIHEFRELAKRLSGAVMNSPFGRTRQAIL
jgi:hypothetical protein